MNLNIQLNPLFITYLFSLGQTKHHQLLRRLMLIEPPFQAITNGMLGEMASPLCQVVR